MSLTAVILTHNDCQNALRALNSVLFADKIIIIDDFSDPRNFALLQQFQRQHINQASLLQRKLTSNFAAQRNFGLQKATTDWVLFVDSDEIVDKNLKEEILQAIKSDNIFAYWLKRTDIFMGTKLNHGETASLKFLRLAKKDSGDWQEKVHEIWKVPGKTKILKNPLIHERYLAVSQFLQRLDIYSSIRANLLYEQKIKEPGCFLFLKPWAKFGQNYFLRLGFLDGFAGLAMAWLMSWHSFLVRLKLQMLWKNNGSLTFLPKNND